MAFLVGDTLGLNDGDSDGAKLGGRLGAVVGDLLGRSLGILDGVNDGYEVSRCGTWLGIEDGELLLTADGLELGFCEGTTLGS